MSRAAFQERALLRQHVSYPLYLSLFFLFFFLASNADMVGRLRQPKGLHHRASISLGKLFHETGVKPEKREKEAGKSLPDLRD